MYLNSQNPTDLFAPELLKNDSGLRDALFRDLDRCWQQYQGAERTRELHTNWTQTTINLTIRKKIGTSLLHGACCGTGVLRCDLIAGGKHKNDFCRRGCKVKESLQHILMECPHYRKCRVRCKREAFKLKIPFDVTNAMCHPKLHLFTEYFFCELHDH